MTQLCDEAYSENGFVSEQRKAYYHQDIVKIKDLFSEGGRKYSDAVQGNAFVLEDDKHGHDTLHLLDIDFDALNREENSVETFARDADEILNHHE